MRGTPKARITGSLGWVIWKFLIYVSGKVRRRHGRRFHRPEAPLTAAVRVLRGPRANAARDETVVERVVGCPDGSSEGSSLTVCHPALLKASLRVNRLLARSSPYRWLLLTHSPDCRVEWASQLIPPKVALEPHHPPRTLRPPAYRTRQQPLSRPSHHRLRAEFCLGACGWGRRA
jgi:hypothetical protein